MDGGEGVGVMGGVENAWERKGMAQGGAGDRSRWRRLSSPSVEWKVRSTEDPRCEESCGFMESQHFIRGAMGSQ